MIHDPLPLTATGRRRKKEKIHFVWVEEKMVNFCFVSTTRAYTSPLLSSSHNLLPFSSYPTIVQQPNPLSALFFSGYEEACECCDCCCTICNSSVSCSTHGETKRGKIPSWSCSISWWYVNFSIFSTFLASSLQLLPTTCRCNG